MFKENSLKSFLQKSGETYFRYSQTGEKLNLRKKSKNSVWCEKYLKVPETTTLKKRLPKLECKSSDSYNDS